MSISAKARVAGILGWPVGHSKSPRLHGYWLAHHKIDGAYVPLPTKPENLASAVRGLVAMGFTGANVTVPHKEAVFALVDDITPAAKRIGAVNTLFIGADGKIRGDNTDAFGFIENLRRTLPDFSANAGPAAVLGAGGAARAVAVALADAGCKRIVLINRTPERAATLAQAVGSTVAVASWENRATALENATLLVNTTSLGMTGQPALDLSLEKLPKNAAVYDLVYAPLETPLLSAAKARGHRTVDGLGMLLYQAQAGFAGWFGVKPDVTPELRAHVLAA